MSDRSNGNFPYQRHYQKDHMPFVKPTHVAVEYGAPIYPKAGKRDVPLAAFLRI